MKGKTKKYFEQAQYHRLESENKLSLALKNLLLEKGVSPDFADRFSVSFASGGEDVVQMDGEDFVQGLDIYQLDEMTKEQIYNLDPNEPHIALF